MSFAEFIVRSLTWGIYNLFRNGLVRTLLKDSAQGDAKSAAVIGVGLLLCVAVSYLLGSVNAALVVSRHRYHDDVRKHGSGNAGATNVMRTYGPKAGLVTFLGDAFKGVLSILFACLVFGYPSSEPNYLFLVTAVYLSGFFCILGHVFPAFSHFKGGKGVSTMAGVVLLLNPFLFVVMFILYVPLVLGSHYVSLGSVIMAMFYPLILSVIDRVWLKFGVNVLSAFAIAVLVVWAHRENLKRISKGTERKLHLGHRKQEPPAPEQPADPPSDRDEE